MKHFVLEGFLEKHRDAFRNTATAKIDLFAALGSSFKPLTNFTQNLNIGAMGILNTSLESPPMKPTLTR